ncbi:glucose 1-dehydrogenase [Paenochrobactrum sp. BZR 588]|uniref:glucose 1-dehydrogenase n=1 Tax=Paenochrobactrum TaxID=999488 RepID=UPI0035BC0000
MQRLAGKVAIITGAGSGFGAAMAKRFSQEGARIVLVDLNAKHIEDQLDDLSDEAIAVRGDVSRKDSVADIMQTAYDRFGHIDIMVNNAGFTHRNQPLTEVSEDNFDLISAVNMKSVYYSTLALAPLMEQQGGGVIINMASATGRHPRKGLAWYSASKGWVISATKALALELAEKKIRVNCICPVESDSGALPLFLSEDTAEAREQLVDTIPMGRLSTPTDVANAALWLASDEAAFITGAAIDVDGGYSI